MTHITYFNVGLDAFDQTNLDRSFWICFLPLCTLLPVLSAAGRNLAVLDCALF